MVFLCLTLCSLTKDKGVRVLRIQAVEQLNGYISPDWIMSEIRQQRERGVDREREQNLEMKGSMKWERKNEATWRERVAEVKEGDIRVCDPAHGPG